MPFSSALKNFYVHGSFELTDSQIFLENVLALEKRIKHLKEDKPDISFYQIHLNNINLISGILPQSDMPNHVLSGAIVEHNQRPWNGRLTDVALTQMMSINGFNAPLNIRNQDENPERQLAVLKNALLSLLTHPNTWNSIELGNVFFYQDNKINYHSTDHFYNELLGSLLKNDLLRELNLKPFSLTKHRNSLINFLTQHTQLEVLCLEVSEANRQDWLELSQILAIHPKLKSFNLGHSILDTNAYSALRDLLDENYRIKISLTEPTEENLLKVYEPLKQRLAKSNLERFKEDHLSQTKLLQVAISDLESQDQALKQFNFKLTNKGHLAITDNQKEDWVKNVDVLPTIYQYHKDYLKNESSLIQLHVDEFIVNESKTVGYVLLEKALETKNLMAMQTLLNAKVDLFELPDNEENPFLVKLLQSKGDLKRVVVEHIRRDQRLAELAAECLTAYPDLSHNFGDLKTHLDQYSSHLVKRETPYALLAISNEILGVCRGLFGLQNPADTRGKECAQIYLDLDKSLQIIKADPEGVTYHNLSKIQRIMKEIKENSTKALRGLFNKSLLHEKVVILVDQFYDKLETSKNELDAKKDETIKQKDDEIKQIKENHKAEKSFLNDKLTKMETENAEIKAKNAEIKTENAEIKAQNLEIKQTLDNIIKQLNFKEPISLGTSSSSMSQDQTKTETRGFFKS